MLAARNEHPCNILYLNPVQGFLTVFLALKTYSLERPINFSTADLKVVPGGAFLLFLL